MERRRTILRTLPVALGLLLPVLPACYTLLAHPRVHRDVHHGVASRDCNSCHTHEELWSYHHPPTHPYSYDPSYPAWAFYYSVPWWYNDYWYYDEDDPAMIPLPSRDLRPSPHADLRGAPSGAVPAPAPEPAASPARTKEKSNPEGDSNDQSKKRTERPPRPQKEKDKPND